MASAAFDGHYAIAQIWKLDTSPLFKGRHFQLSSFLAEYLMPPLLPGAVRARRRPKPCGVFWKGSSHASAAGLFADVLRNWG